MNIGDVAERSGLPAKTIRYYEDIGLVKPLRSANGYRSFRDRDVHKLAFLGRARALGFSIEDCRNLLKLYEDDDRTSSEVKQIAEVQLDRIDRKIAELTEMRATLAHLVDACAGDHRPDCPILADLAAKEEEIALLNEAG
ncbi:MULTISPECIES: Cu(I)-responsive transcriptional regulator [Alphaproteobacteria]|jgi:MerR family transcriptional regulator, copper efflux regulator|uniref:Cu(I)-responsive transcriptional regulator n=5 Tax=Alphaproteobacteria TaxID=28211 RepID=A0A4R3NV98_9HYPH|nr:MULTISPECIES: Cu(I)-responsive transcriptional regulator [Alphaproteobacteria]MDN5567418.1 Cu(I)-responsive transcriptional regulator [Paracoccus sp. (in: a-proteobacteria)]QRX65096.1 Cu(I)-responsive transcriptional regulator [Dysgonomonadaceae bacterium zrk40]AQZ54304.1 Copper export regulator [Martelella mediterranea DSM 17316]MDV2968057.1 Cu(I)-responsive transcriptional regulator [Nitratireductor aquimarinus]PTX36374.1 Cu(I)-responsive transcriptional regulator [Allosediminivita pacifi|tara:strand:+ start:150 stop:569 length:420 start_codon:yes stop_codon:yes gene_type:complete